MRRVFSNGWFRAVTGGEYLVMIGGYLVMVGFESLLEEGIE